MVLTQNERNRRRHDMNQSAIVMLKLESGCVDCGYNEHPAALEFDHVGPKRFGIGDSIHRSMSDTLDEIDNCEVVCANCHRVRTEERRWAKEA